MMRCRSHQGVFLTAVAAAATKICCASGFAAPPTFASPRPSVRPSALGMSSSSEQLKRRSVHMPLLDLSPSSSSSLIDKVIVPLPSAHLPEDLTTLNVYGFEVTAPVHKMLVENALGRGDQVQGELGGAESCYGHVVQKDPTGEEDVADLVGAIGCAAEVIVAAPIERGEGPEGGNAEGGIEGLPSGEGGGGPLLVLARGSYRFVVREIVQTFPYPVGIVDELLDDEPSGVVSGSEVTFEDDEDEDDEDDDDDDYDWYSDLTPSELVQRTLMTMKALVDQRLSSQEKEPSPLEMAIMEDAGLPIQSAAAKRTQAEEMGAVLDVFLSSLIDIAPMPVDRYYAIGMLAAEMADVENEVRRKILTMKDGVERLRVVLKELDRNISAVSAKKLTAEITDKAGGGPQELKVGTPALPPWAKQIKKGTKIEYFWNEEYGWCGGEVSEDPFMVVDELIITVKFDDGSTYKLPFSGEEKVRWRPASM